MYKFFLDVPCVSAVDGAAQLLEGFSDSLVSSLKDVLVERQQLTLGKELGKGQQSCLCMSVFLSTTQATGTTVQTFNIIWLTAASVSQCQ